MKSVYNNSRKVFGGVIMTDLRKEISYAVACVSEFASRYDMIRA